MSIYVTEILTRFVLKPYPSENMEEWRVGDEARNPKNDYPEVMKPLRSEDGV
jgi:hypothetical protein